MKTRMVFFMFLASVMGCHVHAVNISGVVKKIGGGGLEGVKVKLGKANLVTTTDSNGSFTLTDVTDQKYQPCRTSLGNDRPFVLEGNNLFFHTVLAEVKMTVYDCNGRLLASLDKVISEGNRSMTLPHFGSGIQIYRVSIDGKPHNFKIVTGTVANHISAPSRKESVIAKQAKATVRIDDALLFIKQGYQFYRVVVMNPDTSGLQITMAPLDTGTVTDADGNVYKTVRIGNQYWTAENLRTTKYNDNTSIPQGSGYEFYNNSTDAAAKKKWGALYTQDAVKTGKLAPTGWRVPTNADWDTLQNYLISHGYNYDGTTKEDKTAKSMAAATDWEAVSEPGAIGNDLNLNNASGFSALPAGWRYWDGKFQKQNSAAYWWIANSSSVNVCDLWWINFNLDRFSTIYIECSVRLVRHI